VADPAITIDGLHYHYPNTKKEALIDANLTINQGEFVAVIGKTGSGKSTLVSLIDGLLQPTAGRLNVTGVEITPTTKQAQLSSIHHHVGFVFQFPEQQLFAETVADDIAFGPRNLGWSEEKITASVDEALQLVNLPQEFKTHSPFALSGGQMRRVAIAGVLATKPAILILDEPTAGLDNQATNDLLKLVDQVNQQGTTVIMVTHQMEQVAEHAGRVLVMDHGKIIANTTPKKLFNNGEQLAALSLSLPIPVAVAHSLKHNGIHLQDNEPLTMAALADQLAMAMRGKTDE
jgi:energy-coupling factor transport system ATP-binding protein